MKGKNMSPQISQENNSTERVLHKNEEEYEAPSLIEYGQVVELTNGTGSMNADIVANRRKN
jgi:hypothetical protein